MHSFVAGEEMETNLRYLLRTARISDNDLQSMLDSAQGLTETRLSICDDDVNHFVRSRKKHFCRTLAHRECPGLENECTECDKRHIDQLIESGKPYDIYDCEPLGPKDFLVAVMFRGKPILFLVGGAVLEEGKPVESVCEKLEVHGWRKPREELAFCPTVLRSIQKGCTRREFS